MSTSITLEYEPRKEFEAFHSRGTRWSCIVAHRRCGKTVACVNDLHERALYTNKKNARYGYIAPFYSQAKNIAWDYLKDATKDTAVKVSESTLTVDLLNGSRISLYGADNPNTLRGLYFDGVILDEYGDCRPSLWGEVILPTLADRKGWAVFIGTPKGKNHFYDIYRRSRAENWFHNTLKASQTGIIDPGELFEMKAQMTEDQYDQEFECSFDAAVVGTYFAHQIVEAQAQGRVMNVPYNTDLDVHVAFDLGYTDSTAAWFWQNLPDGYNIIDYEEADGKELEYYFDLLEQKPYEYGVMWLPHDAKARTLATARSTIEQFVDYFGPEMVDLQPRLKVQHGIDAARSILPLCRFDENKCKDGLDALLSYRRSWNERTQSFSNTPLHDWASNGADAFRGLSLVAKQRKMKSPEEAKMSEYDRLRQPPKYTLNELFKDRESNIINIGGRRRL